MKLQIFVLSLLISQFIALPFPKTTQLGSFQSQIRISDSTLAASSALSIFYCGFGSQFCGQSTADDVNPKASIVILAFANTNSDGSITVDQQNFPSALIKSWKSSGKKVILSVGGQNGHWNSVFASDTNINNFIKTVTSALIQYKLDGVDLDIEAYIATPRTVANTIMRLKSNIAPKLLIVSPECVTVYEGTPVPSPDVGGQAWNYFVPIINLVDKFIDFYQPQAYNNWYGGLAGGSAAYLKEVYLNWRNLPSSIPWTNPIPGFAGVEGSKLLLGVLASSSAGGAAYYAPASVIGEVRGWLKANNYPLKGFMIWDSSWDKKNNFQISDACTQNQ